MTRPASVLETRRIGAKSTLRCAAPFVLFSSALPSFACGRKRRRGKRRSACTVGQKASGATSRTPTWFHARRLRAARGTLSFQHLRLPRRLQIRPRVRPLRQVKGHREGARARAIALAGGRLSHGGLKGSWRTVGARYDMDYRRKAVRRWSGRMHMFMCM
jgi:hypothetical protein